MTEELEISECLEVLGNHYIGRLAFLYGKSPYIVPITYFHDAEEKSILSYSNEGHKLEALRQYGKVAFQVDDIESVQNWRSVQVHGRFEELTGSTAKKYLHRFAEGVQATIERTEGEHPKFVHDFSVKLLDGKPPIAYRIRITDIIGKTRKG